MPLDLRTTAPLAFRSSFDSCAHSPLDSASSPPTRYVGIDTHKDYLLACGVNSRQEMIYGPRRVPLTKLAEWATQDLRASDAVVVEMTLNTWTLCDVLEPYVKSVTVVHPPHVRLITQAQVKTDKRAALGLAQLHAAGLLPAVWVPPREVRDLRALVAQRRKLQTLGSQAKCRLHAVLHRLALTAPEGMDLFDADARSWWEALPVSSLECFRLGSDLDTLAFAQEQVKHLDRCLGALAAQDPHVPLLVQVPGIGVLGAMQILAAVGDISRFPTARHLVGYAGLGTQVHESGQLRWSGRITKQGRKDLRWTMVQAAHAAVGHHRYWKEAYARMAGRLGPQKAIVAVARRLLVTVWHVLSKEEADCHADAVDVARSLFRLAYRMGVRNLPPGTTALSFTRAQLDRLRLGRDLTRLPWGSKTFTLPPSQLDA